MILLAAHDLDMQDGFWSAFKNDVQGVQIVPGDASKHDADSYVLECDSFGFIKEGLFDPLIDKFGWKTESISQLCGRSEMPVGTVKEVPGLLGKTVFITPVVRVFGDMQKNSVAPYLATKAILQNFTGKTIVLPGIGTRHFGANHYAVARQMRQAIEDVRNEWSPVSHNDAVQKHLELIS